jgi:hypothetical protein
MDLKRILPAFPPALACVVLIAVARSPLADDETPDPSDALRQLDRVSVTMTRPRVRDLMGDPAVVGGPTNGLTAELYTAIDAAPLHAAGFLYDDDGVLAGKSLVLTGHVAERVAESLQGHGFVRSDLGDGARLVLSGHDDDTGYPLSITILEEGPNTLLMVFDESFYDRQAP